MLVRLAILTKKNDAVLAWELSKQSFNTNHVTRTEAIPKGQGPSEEQLNRLGLEGPSREFTRVWTNEGHGASYYAVGPQDVVDAIINGEKKKQLLKG